MKSSVAQEHAGYGLVDTFLSTGQNEIKAQEAISYTGMGNVI